MDRLIVLVSPATERVLDPDRFGGREPERVGRREARSWIRIRQGGTQRSLGPLVAGFVYAPFGDLEAVAERIDEQTAAIMIEPVQGEGGVLTRLWRMR